MRKNLVNFVSILRSHDIRVSPAETIDALNAISVLKFDKRSQIRDGLAMTLAKTKLEEKVFLKCFDQFFNSELPNINSDNLSEDTMPPQNLSNLIEKINSNKIGNENLKSQIFHDLAQTSLMKNLMTNNRTELALSLRRAAEEVSLSKIKLFTQKGLYTRKMLDSMGEEHLRNTIEIMEKSNDQSLNEIKAYRDMLRQEVKNFVEREYMLQAEARNKQLSDDILIDVRLSNIESYYLHRAKDLITKMARKLTKRYGKQIKRSKKGRIHMPRTLREGVPHEGILFKTHWKKRIRKKPQIFVICDVSGSVAAYAKFFLIFLYTIQDILPKVRSFAFSSHLGEVSSFFVENSVERAIELVNWQYGGATDYGGSFEDFKNLAIADIDRRSTILILGDARNNQGDPKLEILRTIFERSKQVIWLNPEPRRAWGTGDSEMNRYQTACHISVECGNLRQLERVVDRLLKSTQ